MALKEWAVTCDALARGEQILLLRPGGTLSPRGAADDPELPHSRFWLYPTWRDQRIADVTDPYRDRVRRLLELHRDDGKLRLRYYATVEYRERVASLERLLRLDVEHTLNSRAVQDRFAASAGPGMWLLLLRVHERPGTAVLEERARYRRADPWVELERPVGTGETRPVLSDERFLAEMARLLELAGSIRAMEGGGS